jgi:uncharacterized membrane protein
MGYCCVNVWPPAVSLTFQYVHVYVCMCLCVCVCVFMYVCIYVFMCGCKCHEEQKNDNIQMGMIIRIRNSYLTVEFYTVLTMIYSTLDYAPVGLVQCLVSHKY